MRSGTATVSTRSAILSALRGTAVYMVIVLGWNAMFGLPAFNPYFIAGMPIVIGGKLFIEERYPQHLPTLYMAVGAAVFMAIVLSIFRGGGPDDERTLKLLGASMALVLVLIGVKMRQSARSRP